MARSILFVKTSSLGDVIHNMPAVVDARRRFPNARIDWAVEEAYAPLVRSHPSVDRVIAVAIRRWRRALVQAATWREVLALRRDLGHADYDAVIDTQGLVKSAFVASLARGVHFGFDRASVRERLATRFYDRTFRVDPRAHATARCRQLAAFALGYAPAGALDYGLAPAAAAGESAGIVLLHGTARAAKEWPEAAWRALAAGLIDRGHRVTLLHGSPAEAARSVRLAAGLPDAIVAARMPIDRLAALIAGAHAVIGVDTGLLHLAVALEVPTVAVFRATDPALTGPVGRGSIATCGGVDRDPSVEEVFAALEPVLAASRQ